VTIPK